MLLRLTALEWLLKRLNLLPTPLLDTPLAPGIGKVLATACELGLFDILNAGPLSAEEIAERLDCHPQRLRPLLQVLVATEYLHVRRARYSNCAVARRWLSASSPVSIAPYIAHSPDIVALWEHLPEMMRTNQAVARMPYEDDVARPEVQAALARHYAGLAALARILGKEIVYRVPLSAKSTHLLDVGGSHGVYSLLFCRKHPALHATIVDLPPGIEAGKSTTQDTEEHARIDFLCRDIVRETFPVEFTQAFDVALYFHIAHLLPAEVNQQLLKRVVYCLKPGGLLVFVDQLTEQKHTSRLTTALVQLMALTVSALGGTCYPFATVKGWLECAGLDHVRRQHLYTPGVSLIVGRKPRPVACS
ncbi:MAG TPA: class I SAM-dependent methyltransferase [Ktedonobacteraceae bacterium]|nr:class I SAM-dependent methyltransferase [Ktedonobacteraceae bacterium]